MPIEGAPERFPQRAPQRPPLVPARLEVRPDGSAPGVPYSSLYDDVYRAPAGAWPQVRHVFLGGNDLPRRWQGRQRFVILETGFGLGNNFLATWAAWRADPARCERLIFISIEKHPLTARYLAEVHATRAGKENGETDDDSDQRHGLAARLVQAWPVLTSGFHTLDFDEPELHSARPGASVTLQLGLGDVKDMIPALLASVDAFYLDGFAPLKNPDMWDAGWLSRLGRRAAPGATAATWSAGPGVRDALVKAGFEWECVPGFGDQRETTRTTRARFAPRFVSPPKPGGLWPWPERGADAVSDADLKSAPGHAIVVGAGLAGCAAAWALTREGWRVSLIDRHAQVAGGASGNVAGLFHAVLHGEDGIHARLHRAAALSTAALAEPWMAEGRLAGRCDGVLRLDADITDHDAAALLARLSLPPEHVRWLPRNAARAQCGLSVPSGGWLFAKGGWLDPAGYAAALFGQAMATGLLSWRPEVDIHAIGRSASGAWQIRDEQGGIAAEASVVVLANAADAVRLTASLPAKHAAAALPMEQVRGQMSVVEAPRSFAVSLSLPVADGGYVIRLTDGRLLCGATSQPGDMDAAERSADHEHNLAQAVRLGALSADDAASMSHSGRVAWRATTPDRLPLIGALPWSLDRLGALAGSPKRLDQPALVPRLRDETGGVFVFSGLGSRGISWAALGGRLIAHWVAGSPCPIESDLRDALDPARFVVRQRVKDGAKVRLE